MTRHSSWRKVLGIWLAWTVAGLFYFTQESLTWLYRGEPIAWHPVFGGWMTAMYICAAFTPAILWLGRRWPLQQRRSAHLAVHLGLSALFSIVSQALKAPVLMVLGLFPPVPQATSMAAAVPWLVVNGFHGGVIRYWAVIGLQVVVRSHQRAREREREALELRVKSMELAGQLTAAQLSALKMQLQPHFLFNTLGAIMVLVQQHRTEDAEAMLSRLSDLLRLTLDEARTQEVPLWRELALLRVYLAIEQVRFQERLRILIDAEPDVHEALVPHMLLQPIVENAVRHGLGESEEAVTIEVKATRTDSRLVLSVADDGAGASAPGSHGRGIGLTNTRSRLQHLYGVDATFVAHKRVPRGVLATLTIPWHTSDSEESDALESTRRR